MDISGGKNLPLILLNMKEQDFIKIIKDQTKSSYLGDDCAYLKELEIVVGALWRIRLQYMVVGNISNVLFVSKISFPLIITSKMKDRYILQM